MRRLSVCGMEVKPVVSQAALRTAIVIIGGMLILLSQSPLADMPELISPRWLSFMAMVGGILGGKEGLKRLGDYASNELPIEWVEAVEQVNAQAQPKQDE
jgi:hypothetical protein